MKICIIGDGLVSLTLAKALVNKDICVDVFYNKKHKNHNQTRTLGISKSNIEYFNSNILNIEKLLWEIKKIIIYTENSSDNEIIKFDDSNKRLFSIIQNHQLQNLLAIKLKKNKFFNYKKNIDFKILLKKDYKLIINCESDNLITKKFFSKKIEKKYDSFAHTTIIEHKKILPNNVATQIFTNKGPIAFLPISNTKTSIVYSIRVGKNKNKIDINNLIKKFNPKYDIKKIYKISSFELKSSNLRRYYSKNILACGDLLHRLHPLAGQGFNMSVRDIKELTELIENRISLGLDLDSSICIEFQNRTKDKNYIFSKGIDWIYEVFNFESKINTNILSKSIKLISMNKSFKKIFRKFADIGLKT